jgi:hypothetical protein
VCSRTHQVWSRRLVELSNLVVVDHLCCLFCSPSASRPNPKRQKVVGTKFAGDDVPAGGSAETTGTDPVTTSAGVVIVAVVGTPPSERCDPATSNEYRGYKTTSTKAEESRYEEIFNVSAAPCS